jgi:hypothetical protein
VATTKGGAIYYNLYRPTMTNVTFLFNSAPYGNNIASYPVKIVDAISLSTDIILTGIASGQIIPTEIQFMVVDIDNQISSVSNGGRVTIDAISSGAFALGENSASFIAGK